MVRRMSMAAGIAGLLAWGTGCDLAAPGADPQPCGGRDDAPCPTGSRCVDDPACAPGGDDACAGVCAPAVCGDRLSQACPNGQACVDDPDDDCEPDGRAACPRVCAGELALPVACSEAGRTFVSHDEDLCAQILFICEVGWVPFYDGCGCGCALDG